MADNWRVISQRQTTALTQDGRFDDVIEVTVEIIGGTVITERIPVSQYNADTARARIEARVADVLDVGNL